LEKCFKMKREEKASLIYSYILWISATLMFMRKSYYVDNKLLVWCFTLIPLGILIYYIHNYLPELNAKERLCSFFAEEFKNKAFFALVIILASIANTVYFFKIEFYLLAILFAMQGFVFSFFSWKTILK